MHFVKSINQSASIFTAECISLNQAIEYALTRPNENAIIFTDSLSAIMSLRNLTICVKSSLYILELRKKILEFSEKRNNGSHIKFFWVPAHLVICGNESANLLAKSATQETVSSTFKYHLPTSKNLQNPLSKKTTPSFSSKKAPSKELITSATFTITQLNPGSAI